MHKQITNNQGKNFSVDEESYSKICRIVGDILNKQLYLLIKGERSWTNGQRINLPVNLTISSPIISDKQIHYTLLEHELAHILFQSDERNYKLLQNWALEFWNKKLVTQFPQLYNRSSKTISNLDHFFNKLQPYIENACRMIYNIVEDVRIEHAWGEIYIGSKFRFKHLARNIINHKPTNAFDVLFSIRANRLDYIPKEYEELTHQFQKLLKEVEGKSPGMTLTISQEIIKIMADEFFRGPPPPLKQPPKKKLNQKIHNECQSCGKGNGDQWIKKFWQYNNKFTWVCKHCGYKIPNQNSTQCNNICKDIYNVPNYPEERTYNSNSLKLSKHQKQKHKKKLSQNKPGMTSQERIAPYIFRRKILENLKTLSLMKNTEGVIIPPDTKTFAPNSKLHTKIKTEPINNEQAELFEQEEKTQMDELATKQHNQLMKKIKEFINPDKYNATKSLNMKCIGKIATKDTFDKMDVNNYYGNNPDERNRGIDTIGAQKMGSFFNHIKEKNKQQLDEEGDEVDPEAYIQFKANPNENLIFNNLNSNIGLDIGIILDLSGSMYGVLLDDACSYTRTIMKSVEKLPNVNVTVYGYAGYNTDPYKTAVIQLDDRRLQTIIPSEPHETTHTWNAIAYTTNKMRGAQGKKLIILITDGMPYHGIETCEINAALATRESVEYAYLTGCKVFTIQIGDLSKRQLNYMYGPRTNWVIADDNDRMKLELWSRVVTAVWRSLTG